MVISEWLLVSEAGQRLKYLLSQPYLDWLLAIQSKFMSSLVVLVIQGLDTLIISRPNKWTKKYNSFQILFWTYIYIYAEVEPLRDDTFSTQG